MNFARLVLRSLQFHASKHLAVILGVMAATAVLTGALVVGESVRSSLRELTLDRLGRIDHLLLVDRFFRAELANELKATSVFKSDFSAAVPAIIIPTATAELPRAKSRSLAAGVQLIAAGPEFWELNQSPAGGKPIQAPQAGEVLLNEPLAIELNAKVGDTVILRMAKATQVSADSPLGKKDDRLTSLAELKVREIIPAKGLGRFSLHPMQTSPRNAFVALSELQEGLEQEGKVNALLIAAKTEAIGLNQDITKELQAALSPSLEDYGLAIKHVQLKHETDGTERDVLNYFSLSSNRMLIDEPTERVALAAWQKHGAYPVLTYLANWIDKIDAPEGTKGVPYSMITAIPSQADSPLVDVDGNLLRLNGDEIAITSWVANDQKLEIGNKVRVTYFEPETTHGDEKEQSAEFRVKAIVPLTEPTAPYSRLKGRQFEKPPTRANDPDLTPEVPGVTDQASIADWDAPFPFEYKRMRKQDDIFWNNHRTTPKAYIPVAAGKRLWKSRFGSLTSLHVPFREGMTKESLADGFISQLKKENELLGFEFAPIKARDLGASAGTTPFDALFLILSMFIIGAALLLIWLLFRLGIEQRASEIGLVQALGWSQPLTGKWLAEEGIVVSAIGALLGIGAGVGYAAVMIHGLRTWWVGAIATPFLTLHVGWLSLTIGFFVGLIVAQATIYFSLRQLRRVSPRQLLAGETSTQSLVTDSKPLPAWRLVLPYGFLLLAIVLAGLASVLKAEAQAASFLAAGASVLTGMLMLMSRRLGVSRANSEAAFRWVLPSLALRNIGRARGRSMATIALVASASFLVVAVSSFRLSPTEQGIGGFNLIAESSEPILPDLNDPKSRKAAIGADADKLTDSKVIPLRMRAGDDASCRNLYQALQPRVLGVTPAMINHFDSPNATKFMFASSAAKSPEQKGNPWRLLEGPVTAGEPIPVVLDMNTALYSLKLYRGIGESFERDYGDGPPVKFRVVGFLSNSVLQGSLLIGEADFKRTFPRVSGYRSFLVQTPADKQAEVAAVLEGTFSDEGFDVTDSRARLSDLLAVQNTYISTFQALGALGLLLGTFGLAAVQLRNVFERRKELAMLRATGFRGARIAGMVMIENLLLLCGGLFTGLLAALLAVLPHMYLGGASLPWLDLAWMLATILIIGGLVGLIAVRATLKAPIIAALRGE